MVETISDRTRAVKIEDEMRGSYLDYAMSVIVARALPDVRDGLKPVQRRILYAMDEMGLRYDRPYKKSARVVGEVLGKYHPHSDTAVYDALVRMAQNFSMRYPLVDGQGNFGSVDNDPPAAMRYTEVRLTEIAHEMLADINQDTVDSAPNFDDSLTEPIVLPARLPNLLLNGSSGIAVGMATNIPPHNLAEICKGVVLVIDNPGVTAEELVDVIPGPDFPTGGVILGRDGIKSAYATGHGRIVVRAKARIEEITRGGRYQILVTELPYQTNKASLIERIADLVRERKIEGISDLRDESDRHGMRVVIEMRRDAQPRQVLNALFKHTAMQAAFYVNMLALVDSQPRVISLKAALQHYIDFRRVVIRRRSQFDLKKARERAHILEGLKIALDHLDEVIQTIRSSRDAETARANLRRRFHLSEAQAQAILDMQLRRLAALERRKVLEELAEILKKIAYLEDLLANPKKIDSLIKDETKEIGEKYGDPRRTIISDEEALEFTAEDLIQHQEMLVTMSQGGYIKRTLASTYRPQRRGGRGITAMTTREEDSTHRLVVADTHHSILFFSNRGRVFQIKCHEVPESSRQSKGQHIVNLISLNPAGEMVTEMVAVESFEKSDDYLILATRLGEVKKTSVREFDSARSYGLNAMDLEEGDELVSVRLAKENEEIILVSEQGKALRFSVKGLRSASRQSGGVRGIKLAPGDLLVAMDVVRLPGDLLVVSAHGMGKRTSLSEYHVYSRGTGGVEAIKVTPKTGPLVAAMTVQRQQEVMITSSEGIVIRTPVSGISRQGRAAGGVHVMKMEPKDKVVALAALSASLASENTAKPDKSKPKEN